MTAHYGTSSSLGSSIPYATAYFSVAFSSATDLLGPVPLTRCVMGVVPYRSGDVQHFESAERVR